MNACVIVRERLKEGANSWWMMEIVVKHYSHGVTLEGRGSVEPLIADFPLYPIKKVRLFVSSGHFARSWWFLTVGTWTYYMPFSSDSALVIMYIPT